MALKCQHCGTRYTEFAGHAGFCCAGCAQVYHLINEQGFAGYYDLQDRIGRPPVLSSEKAESVAWAERAQLAAESGAECPQLTLSISGMSCMGCVWLVERLARAQPGVRSVKVYLETNTVVLEWEPGALTVSELIGEWRRFGYEAKPAVAGASLQLSPLLWRIVLCGLFAANSLLLGALAALGLELAAYSDLFRLLTWLIVLLSFVVGASFFIVPALQSLRLRRVHYDLLPALGLSLAGMASVAGLAQMEVWSFSLLVTGGLAARWWHRRLWRGYAAPAAEVASSALSLLHSSTVVIAVIGLGFLIFGGIQAGIAAVLAGCLYPLVRSVSHQPSAWLLAVWSVLNLAGVLLAGLVGSPFLALAWMALSGAAWSLLFFRFSVFSSTP